MGTGWVWAPGDPNSHVPIILDALRSSNPSRSLHVTDHRERPVRSCLRSGAIHGELCLPRRPGPRPPAPGEAYDSRIPVRRFGPILMRPPVATYR